MSALRLPPSGEVRSARRMAATPTSSRAHHRIEAGGLSIASMAATSSLFGFVSFRVA